MTVVDRRMAYGRLSNMIGSVERHGLPNLQNPANPVPLMDIHKLVKIIGEGD